MHQIRHLEPEGSRVWGGELPDSVPAQRLPVVRLAFCPHWPPNFVGRQVYRALAACVAKALVLSSSRGFHLSGEGDVIAERLGSR